MTTGRAVAKKRASEIGEVVRWILGAWASKAIHVDREAMTLAYGAGLLDLDPAECKAAVVELSKTEEWIPPIALIRERVAAMYHGERRIGVEAWGDVVREIRRVGRHGRPAFADPLVATALADVGGWLAACDADAGDPAIRARFCERYDQLAGQERRLVQLSPGAKSRLPPGRTETAREIGGFVRGLLSTAKQTEDEDDGNE